MGSFYHTLISWFLHCMLLEEEDWVPFLILLHLCEEEDWILMMALVEEDEELKVEVVGERGRSFCWGNE